MRTTKAAVSLVMLLITMCACRGAFKEVPDVPLLRVDISGECSLCEWEVEKNEIVNREKPLFMNDKYRHSLLHTRWDGHSKFVIYDDMTSVLSNGSLAEVTFRQARREAYYGDYVLSKDDNGLYALRHANQERELSLDSSVQIDGKDVRGDELGLAGFYADGDKIHILLNTWSEVESRVKLYICVVDWRVGTSEIYEVGNCPSTMSPAFPPAGTHVIPADRAFLVLTDQEVSKVSIDTRTAEKVLDVLAVANSSYLKGENKHFYLFTRFGYYEGKIIVTVVGDDQMPSEVTYLCLVDKGEVVASVQVDAEYVAPNLWSANAIR